MNIGTVIHINQSNLEAGRNGSIKLIFEGRVREFLVKWVSRE